MPRIAIRASTDQVRVWKEEARKQGLSLSAFIRHRVDSSVRTPNQEAVANRMLRCMNEMEDYLAHLMFMPPHV